MSTVPDALRVYHSGTLVVRAIDALVAVMPGMPPVTPYGSVGDALVALSPQSAGDEAKLRALEALAIDPIANSIAELGAAVDGSDRVLARQLLHPPHVEDPHESQAGDAALKALAIGAIARRISGSSEPGARARALTALPSGQLMLAVWAALDVALPLGGTDVAKMVSIHQAAESSRLATVGGEHALDGAVPSWAALAEIAQPLVDAAASRTEVIARSLAPFVPGLISRSEGAAERVAVQSDRMPIYKWLAARVAAEHAATRVLGTPR